MKALVWTAPERMEWSDVPEPTVGVDEVLIRVATAGICGSDLEGYLGHNSLRKPPLLMGHEFTGIIEETGSHVTGFAKGQRVVVNPLTSCGDCRACASGLPALCAKRSIVGIHRPGGYADYVSVPAESVILLPDTLSFETAVLTEPLACSLRAARRALDGRSLSTVAVIGAGAIGLLSALSARILGASQVFVADVNAGRLETVRRLGVGTPIDSSSDTVLDAFKHLSGERGVDVVIDAAGFQPTRTLAARLVNPGGVIMNIGLGIDDTIVPVNHYIRSEIDVKGSFCYTRADVYDALHLLSAGHVTGEGWTDIRPLSEGARSFQELTAGGCPVAKILLQPG